MIKYILPLVLFNSITLNIPSVNIAIAMQPEDLSSDEEKKLEKELKDIKRRNVITNDPLRLTGKSITNLFKKKHCKAEHKCLKKILKYLESEKYKQDYQQQVNERISNNTPLNLAQEWGEANKKQYKNMILDLQRKESEIRQAPVEDCARHRQWLKETFGTKPYFSEYCEDLLEGGDLDTMNSNNNNLDGIDMDNNNLRYKNSNSKNSDNENSYNSENSME